MKKSLFVILTFTGYLQAQTPRMLTSGHGTSIRGLSVVNDKIIWASGSNGVVARSVDSGNTWKWVTVKGFETTDFRDIEAFDSSTALIMGISEPAYILKTTDGGKNWKTVYENKSRGMFLDAMDFRNKRNGIVLGDPINNRFFIAQTTDGGDTWTEAGNKFAGAVNGEACFASSGTNISLSGEGAVFVSGGLLSRLFLKNRTFTLPVLQGGETLGANSVALNKKGIFIVVGGDFNSPGSSIKNCVITIDKGNSWIYPSIAPHGYRSCIEYISRNSWITCGLNGIDYTVNNGKTWQWISKEGFHVCQKAKKGNSVFLAGSNGRIAKIFWTLK